MSDQSIADRINNSAMATVSRQLSTAEDRREHVLAAAISEFAQHGYHAASTAAIAKRAGISQPYIYALFASKLELFLACHVLVTDRIRAAFVQAARGAGSPHDAFRAMGAAYRALITQRDDVLFQLQAFASAGASPEIQSRARERFVALIDEVAEMLEIERREVVRFVAIGMYINVATALDLGPEYLPGAPA